MVDAFSEDIVTADCLSVRVDSDLIRLTTGGGALDLKCPNNEDHFERVHELIKILSVSLVAVVSNNGLEGPLVKWLRERGVETVVLHLHAPQTSLIDNLAAASEAYGHAKMILAGIAAVLAGLFIISLGLQADQNGNAIVPGGVWKGSAAILLGSALLAIYVRKLNRKANATH